MNPLLIISFNIKDKVNIINYENTLYLLSNQPKNINKCKYAKIIKNLNPNNIVEEIFKYKSNFKNILLLDNSKNCNVNEKDILDFMKSEKYYVFGQYNYIQYKEKEIGFKKYQISDYYDFHLFSIKTDLIFEEKDLKPECIENMYFPFLSKIIYKNYNICSSNHVPISYFNDFDDNILLI
ncbi:MAG: hypothetical protein ACOCV1_00860 [Bacillota bacterium]